MKQASSLLSLSILIGGVFNPPNSAASLANEYKSQTGLNWNTAQYESTRNNGTWDRRYGINSQNGDVIEIFRNTYKGNVNFRKTVVGNIYNRTHDSGYQNNVISGNPEFYSTTTEFVIDGKGNLVKYTKNNESGQISQVTYKRLAPATKPAWDTDDCLNVTTGEFEPCPS